MVKTAEEIKRIWADRWKVGVRPYLEAIAAVAEKCEKLAGADKMACYAEAVSRKKGEMRLSPDKMIEKGLRKAGVA
jgi:hypothetical protein